VLADVLVVAVVLGFLSGGPAADKPSALEKTLIWLVAVVIALAILAPYAVRKVRIIRLYRLELANKLTLESAAVASSAGTQPPTAEWTSAKEQDVSVRYDKRRVLRQCSWMLVIACCMLLMLVGEGLSSPGMTPVFGALCGFFASFGLFVVVPQVTLLVRWVLPGRPLIELDAEGVHMPSIACDLPWSLLTEVRLFPMRYGRRGGQGAMVVAFMPQDPSAVLGAITVGIRRRKRLERSLRVYGTPLSVCDNGIDHSGEQIAAAAAAYASVPVRRY
jgi:hypothetical protein